jgi:hypothetical protein
MQPTTTQKKPEQPNRTAQANAGTAQKQGCTTKTHARPAKGYGGDLGRFERLVLSWNRS